MPMSSPMMTTMLGRCPAGAGDGVGCCACAELVSPTAESAEAATRELPLSKRSRRFNPLPDCGVALWDSSGGRLLLITCSSRCYAIGAVHLAHWKPTWLVEGGDRPGAASLITLLAIPLAGAPSWAARFTCKHSSYWLGCP